jgi:hypothetical protein
MVFKHLLTFPLHKKRLSLTLIIIRKLSNNKSPIKQKVQGTPAGARPNRMREGITREIKNVAFRSKFSKIYNYWEPGIGVLTNNLYQYSNTHPLVPNTRRIVYVQI